MGDSTKLAYTIDEAVEATGCSRQYLRREIEAGRLAARLLGRRLLVAGDELARWVRIDQDPVSR